MKLMTNLHLFSAFYYITFFALLFPIASALPLAGVASEKRDVFVPTILTPTADTIWHSGETETITWDTSNAPQNITNPIGLVLLRFSGIETPVILASNFSILDGQVDLIAPDVITRTDYSIVLFGDSGNSSPDFQIIGETF